MNREECIWRYRRLLALLEEDAAEIERCMSEEFASEYRKLLDEETEQVNRRLRALYLIP